MDLYRKISKYSPYCFQVKHARFKGGGGSVKQAPNWTPGQGALFDQLTASLGQQWGQGMPFYGGELTPEASELQMAGFRGLGNLTPGTDYFSNVLGFTDAQAPGRMLGQAEQGIAGAMQPYDPAAAEQMMQPMAELAGRQFNDYTVPAIMERYAGRNAADSGAAQRALAKAGSDMSLGLSAQMAPYLYGGQQAAYNRQLQGGQAMGQLSMMPGNQLGQAAGISTGLSQALLGGGAQQRQIAGEQMAEPYQKWQYEQPYNNPWLQYLPTALNAQPFDSFYVPDQPSPWGALAGGGLGLMAGGPMGGLFGMSMGSALF